MEAISKLKSICIFSGGYPTKDNPQFAFIKPFANAIADMGIECFVICPQSITYALRYKTKLRDTIWYDETKKGNKVIIVQPKHITLSTINRKYNRNSSIRAINRIIKKMHIDPQVVYGHFWHLGVLANRIFPEKPLFVATGESNIWVNEVWDTLSIKKMIGALTGIISVSTENYEQSKTLNLCNDNTPYIIAPNAVDETVFKKMNKTELRSKYGISERDRIAIYVGSFSERKGVRRFIEAAKSIPDLKLILIGKGDFTIEIGGQIIFSGPVEHEKISDYLNMADFFVLPTLAEGCCNAIVEALACGLPIISSYGKFNDDILDENCSIRVDPNSIQDIRDAIQCLMDDDNTIAKLSSGALEKAKNMTIGKRTNSIVRFIDENI